ncbi:metal ABC transporter substrate-binding protein [Thermotoga maritima MSB8]|uniref:Putative metal-binding protein TM_0123 n=1 Tax=Thermotoga maritima (strain ATCC 43589 / DSM 3109 / JCM 10099 / NBRC 100826 / MSB8) TaxID=243274 RepID=Y123_THEMA|nr:metal ABC transporter substrate-binding protein [Thermotoga maritima]Q9WXX7.1 RecName: Full=Putative metal-binding protein TM_0123; Flags: Precursor [Thermotoga maritima MSB8]AAD35217.1 zinc ABC transporter, periplasmic zinc-binding protein [Thermotoga maritima MSB8]AGL49047.1 Zinc ABC transporter, periplasmic-binding protein ZnuA [Thermotoga maritima MSB8]AHD18108.1 metal ABC transporter substrate-binding protein [Thermotoga maritima MSB8]AKE26066.1 metal ABC transporter substrate-binding 
MKKILLLLVLIVAVLNFGKTIVTTINPYYLIVSQLLGDTASVKLLVPPGANPHLFSLKPSDAKTLEEADLIVANGLGLEPYLEKYREKTVFVSDFIPALLLIDDNPHIWLDPFFLKYYIVPGLYQVLIEKFPEKQSEIKQKAEEIVSGLDTVIRDSFKALLPYTGKTVVMAHPSFTYFFKEFGLELITLSSGHEHSTSFSTIKEILRKKEQIVALFREPQQPAEILSSLEKELRMKSFVLDPLGVNGEKTIVELLRKNLSVIQEALK